MDSHRAASDITQQVRARFIARGTTLTAWCRGRGIDPGNAWRVLQGKHLGTKGQALRDQIEQASAA